VDSTTNKYKSKQRSEHNTDIN